MFVLRREGIAELLNVLAGDGYTTVGPTIRDGAIVYDVIRSLEDLPLGWTDEQDGGFYRLRKRDDEALFGYVVGPHSWKKYLFPPRTRLWKAQKQEGSIVFEQENASPPRYAFLGVRGCELAAIAVQDKVFLEGEHVDPTYRSRREGAFIVAVNCTQAAKTCFCTSMGTGPKVGRGYDLALTEIGEEILVDAGTDRGRAVVDRLPKEPATESHRKKADARVAEAEAQITREIDTAGIKELLYETYDHPRWDDVAARCLSCANCTMVCPTCFCSNVEEVTDLTGENAERWRSWDSCFTMPFSQLGGGTVRESVRSRYRQWMVHKLASWIDQFGSSGCVGCGRCITWCPVGIDITEEVRAIREESHAAKGN